MLKSRFFEITLAGNRRPDYPEDNTIIVVGKDLLDAVINWKELRGNGKLLQNGEMKSIREVYYVFDSTSIIKP